jgi:hypothetical protein
MRSISAALVVLTIAALGGRASAQALEPRSYVNTPVGINFVLVGYGDARGGVGLDETDVVQDTEVRAHTALLTARR